MGTSRPRAAVVGSGVSGLTAAYLLQRRYDVTLYEAADRLGGHADTHEVPVGDGRLLALDTGFIVHNKVTYPTLTRLFDELGVQSQLTEMSLSVRCDGCGLSYAGSRGWRGLIPHGRQLARPRYLRMLASVPGFYRSAKLLLRAREAGEPTLGEFLRAGGYDRYFIDHLVTPLVCATWSCPPAKASGYPARYIFQFLDNHGMLSLVRSPSWYTVTGGSTIYVQRIAKHLSSVRTETPVRAVRRVDGGVEIAGADGDTAVYPAAVMATHADEALRLLASPTSAERAVLGAFTYSSSVATLHADGSLLPDHPAVRASWNYRQADCADGTDGVQISYYLNRLQSLDEPVGYVVTLNDQGRIDPDLVITQMSYRHPNYTRESVAAQARLPELNGGGLACAGSYHGWGFHEDGCRAGAAAAAALGVSW
ncbi:MAG TPA: FAD-dependent oxidoreductase [Streptosporangiaceae bacterium]|nr:FAD-dependent oxidoreductase [Streptosporangiaceae bacterium]